MGARKVHKHDYTYWTSWPEPVRILECGREYGPSTHHWHEVTCKRCLARKPNHSGSDPRPREEKEEK